MPETSNTEHRTPEGAALPTLEELAEKLQVKHRQLVELYLQNGLNISAAARVVGYRNPTEGHRIMRRPEVMAYRNALLAERQLSKDAILAKLEYLSEASMATFVRIAPTERSYWVRATEHEEVREFAKKRGVLPNGLDERDLSGMFGSDRVAQTEDGVLMVQIGVVEAEPIVDWRAAEQQQALGHIKKLKIAKNGTIEFELHDPVKPLELAGKAQKMFTDRVEMSGNGGGPVQVLVTRRIVAAPATGGDE